MNEFDSPNRRVACDEASRWERFARTNPEHYILTSQRRYADADSLRMFFDSGESVADTLLARCRPWMEELGNAVEIGCGVGRLTLPMAGWFREVRAIDISPSMLSKLLDNCELRKVTNVSPWLAAAEWDTPSYASLCYSWIVMQHIEDFESIRTYLRRITRVLEDDGVACLQFDTRLPNALYRFRNRLPEWCLPQVWRRGIRRIRREADMLRRAFAAAGLRIIDEHEPDGCLHTFVLRRDR